MPITNSYLTVTPTWESKRLTILGSASVRETVDLRIVGCGTDTSIVFKLSSENGRVDYAKFPNADTDAWTVDGEDLVAHLNLNTTLLVAAFAMWGPEDKVCFVCTVASKTNSNLYAVGHKQIGNWMEDADDPVAYSTPLADDIADLETKFADHTHDGTEDGGKKILHANLADVTGYTHTQIDDLLDSHAFSILNQTAAIGTNASNIANQTARINAIVGSSEPGTEIPEINADNDLVPMTEIYTAVRALIAFANTFKGGVL